MIKQLHILLLALLCVVAVQAQVTNTGGFYIPPGGNMAVWGTFSNTGSATILNAGNLYVHDDINNDGTTGYDGGTLFLGGTVKQLLNGSSTFYTTNIHFDNSAGFDMNKRYSIASHAVFSAGLVNALNSSEPLEFNPLGTGAPAIAVAGVSDAAHVNGFIFQKGTGSFIYPSGDSQKYQPVAADLLVNSDGMLCRYYPADAGAAPFLTTGLSATPLMYYNNREYWDLHPAGSATGTVTVYYDAYRGTAINPGFDTVLNVAHKVAAGWNNEGGVVSGTQTAGTVTTAGNISNWSPFTLGSNYELFNLPIELAGFTVKSADCKAILNWSTGTEADVLAFDVQYSRDGVDFETVATLPPAGSRSTYAYTDAPPRGRAYYRLRIRFADGSYSYSMILATRLDCSNHNITVYPNPVTSGEELHVVLDGYEEEVSGLVYDITGRVLYRTVLHNGHNLLSTALLSEGSYELCLMNKNGEREVYKIIIYR